MSGVHATATAFSGAATAYEAARPDYPPDVVTWVCDRARTQGGGPVLDLAAGTGKLTRHLVACGLAVVAVEPVEGMRRTLAAMLPGVPVVAGVAQAIPLRSGTVGTVTVAQAFHWFADEEALRDMRRVLRPGRETWCWCGTADGSRTRLQAGLQALMEPWRRGAPQYSSGAWRGALEEGAGPELFAPDDELHVPWEQPLDVEGVVARVASVSFIAAMEDAERAASARRGAGPGTTGPCPPGVPLRHRDVPLHPPVLTGTHHPPPRAGRAPVSSSPPVGARSGPPGTFAGCRRPARSLPGPAAWRRRPSTWPGGG